MRHLVALYLRLVGAQARSAMQYRASLMAEIIGNLFVTGLDFVAIALLLTRFQGIGGWTLPEVAFLYGASTISFSFTELIAGAFDNFDRLVVAGDFDRVLIRPLGIVFQMLAGAFPLRRLGRMAQGAAVLAYALSTLELNWSVSHLLFFGVMIAGGTLFFLAIFITGAAAAFWTPQTAELTNIFTYGGQFMTSYPMSIYEKWMRAIFTFVIPMAFINYYPALYLLRKSDPFGLPAWAPFLSFPAACAVFGLSLMAWRVGVRRYQSTGS